MAWNEQSLPTPGNPVSSGAPGNPGAPEALPPRPDAAFQPMPNPNMQPYPSPEMQPQPGTYPAEQLMPKETYPGGAPINPLMRQAPPVSQQAVAVGAGMPAGPLPTAAQAQALSRGDETDVDDVVWVNRTKKVIATTHGDPHRRVQLLQQLSVLYLKEKYGRSVHADEV